MFKMNARTVYLSAATMLAIAMLVLSGCNSRSTLDTGAPGGSTVAVTASPTTIDQGATSVIEVTIVDGTNGIANQEVTFTVTPSSAGFFSPSMDTTNANGVAAAIFTATTSGAATITVAASGSSSLNGTVAIAVNTASTGSGSGNVNLTISPSLLLANGSDTALVTISITDALGQPAPNLTAVKITAGEKFIDVDGNGFWSPGIDTLVFDANANGTWDAYGLIPSTATVSGGAGSVQVNYISGNDAFSVYVKVTVDDNGIQGSAEVVLQLSPNTSVNSIFLASDSLSLSVKQTGGIETGKIRATCLDENGNNVPEGIGVTFLILDGPGGGERLGNTGYGPFPAVTNSQGIATAPIHSGTASGTIRIRAFVDTVLSNATQILVAAGPPAYIVLGAEECNVPWWNTVGAFNPVIAVVSDIYHNPVNDSTVVYFTTDEGTIMSHENRTKERQGIATTNWISGTNVPTADGVVLIICETAGGTVADTSIFFNSHWPAVISATGMPVSMTADGESKAIVFVSAVDLNGNPVIGGTVFKADATYLSVAGGVFENGCFGASDRVVIRSAILNVDNSTPGGNDDGIGAFDIVTYYTNTASGSFVVQLNTGNAFSGKSEIKGPSSAAQGDNLPFSVTIQDRFGNPLGDHTLNMTASGGTVFGASQETDQYGEANGFNWTAPAAAGTITITITDTDPRGLIVLTLQIDVT